MSTGRDWADVEQKHNNAIRYLVRTRLDDLIRQLLKADGEYNDRVAFLHAKHTQQYHIDTDPILRNLSGTTKVLSDMVAAMSSYLLATRPRR